MTKKAKMHLFQIWTLFVLILTLVPTPEYFGTKETYYDKVGHFFMFGLFSFLLFQVLGAGSRKKKISISLAAGIVFSLLIEFAQLFVPGRDANHWDFLAGLAGMLVFLIFAYVRRK